MRRVAALLAAALLASALVACGGGGAEPGAPKSATLILDFQPNAVHTGIYSALRRGYYAEGGVKLSVREPSDSADAPKLLRAGRAQFAIMDIHDFGIAREQGLDVVALAPIVQRPLAAVIAGNAKAVATPKDLEGQRVGVTGLPSDDAVLDSVLQAGNADPKKVKRVTIGFNAVADLAAHKIAAATAFWNAEGVALKREGLPTREFRVDEYGAPRYPELVLVTTNRYLTEHRAQVRAVADATVRGYRFMVAHPDQALNDLLASTTGLSKNEQKAELDALRQGGAFKSRIGIPTEIDSIPQWQLWDLRHGILKRPIKGAFPAIR